MGRVLSEEVRRFLQSEKLREEFLKLLSGMTVEVTAQVRLVPDAESDKPRTSRPRPRVEVTSVRTTGAEEEVGVTSASRGPAPRRDRPALPPARSSCWPSWRWALVLWTELAAPAAAAPSCGDRPFGLPVVAGRGAALAREHAARPRRVAGLRRRAP